MILDKKSIGALSKVLMSNETKILLKREVFNDVQDTDKMLVASFFASKMIEVGENKIIDNIRINNIKNKKEYQEIKLNGTGEFSDSEFKTNNGQTYLIGFDYK